MNERRSFSRLARRAGVGAAGAATILTGIVLLPLPGPGTLVILGGLSVLGTEFPRARRISSKAQDKAKATIKAVRKR